MTTVSDQSKFDGPTLVDIADAYWLNARDPDFVSKAHAAHDLGKPWGPYSWVDPGDGAGASQRAKDAADAVGLGVPPLGYALDYEEAGVTQTDLVNALDRAESLGTFDRTWVYTYLYIIGSISGVLRGRSLWLAYYPGNNSGAYPEGQDGPAKEWGAILWQYTSSNGTRDLSRVVDDAAWSAWIGGQTPAPRKVVDDVAWIVEKRDAGAPDQYWEPAAGGCVQLSAAEAYARVLAGIPHVELPTLGLLSYAMRLKATFQAAVPTSSGSGAAVVPLTVAGTFSGTAKAA